MNDLYYEYSQDGVCLNSFDCVFVYKKVRCTNKTEIKTNIQTKNITTRWYNYMYAWLFSNEPETLYNF